MSAPLATKRLDESGNRYEFEIGPGIWTKPIPWWVFEEGEDGRLYLPYPPLDPSGNTA